MYSEINIKKSTSISLDTMLHWLLGLMVAQHNFVKHKPKNSDIFDVKEKTLG